VKLAAVYNPLTIGRWLAEGRTDEAVKVTEEAVDAGHPDACFQLACWLLVGRPISRDLARCRELLNRAAECGQIQARHVEIALMARGDGAAPDWQGAFARLRALARSDQHAAIQVSLLEAMDIDGDGAPRAVPRGEALCGSPESTIFRALLTPDECRHLALVSQMHLRPAHVIDERTGSGTRHAARDCDAGTLGPPQEDLVVQAILKRVAAATGTPLDRGESLNVLRYRSGQQYRYHLDTLPPQFNQRVFSTVLYLNEDYAGGETHFNRSGLTVKGRLGDALLFRNVTADGRPDQHALHAGLPVASGVKWIAMRWIRERPYSPWAGD